MKKHLLTITCVALAFSACGPVYVVHQDPPPQAAPAPAPPPEEVSYQTFYDQLSPYGQWIDDPGYGYVWMPNVGPDFKPYASNGHWVYTDEGWTWDSGYPWGWAAFHYGRWFYQDGYGWMWIPGHEWAPAWVSWRNSEDYYGWAPLGPNVSINVSIGGGYTPPPHYWSFVPHQYVASPQINNYYVNESRNTTIINKTTIINNTTVINNNSRTTNITNNNITNNNTTNTRVNNRYYAGGPNPEEVGRFSGAPVQQVALRESNRPGEQAGNGGLSIYRPRINPSTAPNPNRAGATGDARPAVAPARTQPLNNVRPVNPMRYNNNGNPPAGNVNGADNGQIQNGNGQQTGAGTNRPGGNPFGNRPFGGTPAANGQPAAAGQQMHPTMNPPPQTNPAPQATNPTPAVNTPGSNGYHPRMDGNASPNNNNPGGNTPNNRQYNQPNNGQNNQFRQRGVLPAQPPVQTGHAGQPVPVQGSTNGQPGTQGQHGGLPHGGGPGANAHQQALKPGVKPPPQAHPADDKPKDKEKDKDQKQQ